MCLLVVVCLFVHVYDYVWVFVCWSCLVFCVFLFVVARYFVVALRCELVVLFVVVCCF